MKILLVSHTTALNNGWGRYTGDLRRSLIERGHEVVVLNEWLSENGYAPLKDPDAYLGKSLGWLGDRAQLSAALRALKPDLVHVTVEPYLSLIPLVSVPPHVRVVYTIHGTYAYYPQMVPFPVTFIHTYLYGRALRRVHTVVPVSKNTERVYLNILRDRGIKAPTTEVIHNGVWLKGRTIVPIPASEKPGFVVLSVGAIKARKGILETLLGVIELRKRGVPVSYRIEGPIEDDNTYLQKLRAIVAEAHAESYIQFLGRISSDAAQEEMRHSHVLALLPKAVGNSLEGFGLVYLEANVYGVPAIGARGTASDEAIQDGKSGLLCNAEDVTDVANTLERLSQGVVGPEGPMAWAKEHDWLNIVNAYLRVYGAQ